MVFMADTQWINLTLIWKMLYSTDTDLRLCLGHETLCFGVLLHTFLSSDSKTLVVGSVWWLLSRVDCGGDIRLCDGYGTRGN